MRKWFLYPPACSLLIFLSISCAPYMTADSRSSSAKGFDIAAPTGAEDLHYTPAGPKSPDSETLISGICKEIAGKVYYELKESGENRLNARLAVVAMVPLADFKRDTEFGRMMAEYLLTDLADRGLNVMELRLGKEISILPQTGEFLMTRNIGELAAHTAELDYVVIGTFSNTRQTLILQGRLVALRSGLVETSWRYDLPLSPELLGLFHRAEKPYTIAVKGVNKM